MDMRIVNDTKTVLKHVFLGVRGCHLRQELVHLETLYIS